MIQLFRKVRQRLLAEGRTGKYLKYAIGEIVLVVIGILIALQINNWNEYKKDRDEEQQILKQLTSEFQSNLQQLDEKISIRKGMINASLNLLRFNDHPEKENKDSILYYIAMTQLSPTFDPIVSDIISSDRIQLIENSLLKEKLSLWTSEIIQVMEEEAYWLNYKANGYQPFLIEKGIYRSIMNQFWSKNVINSFQLDKASATIFNIGNSTYGNLEEVTTDPRFEGYVAQCLSFAKLTNSQSFSLRERITEILNLLNEELAAN